MDGTNEQRQWKMIGLIPVVILLVLIISMVVLDYNGPGSNQPYLAFVLQLILVFGVSILLSIVSARAYLLSGSFNVLLPGIALLISGTLLIIAQWAVTPSLGLTLTPNAASTIGNIGILIASALLLLSAVLLWRVKRTIWPTTSRKVILGVTYLFAFFLIFMVIALSLSASLPVFFISGVGSTPVREAVLGLSAIFLSISVLLFGWMYWRTRSSVLYWYTLGITLFAISLIGIVFTVRIGDTVNWTGRVGLYLMGLYFLVAVLSRDSKMEINAGFSERWAIAFRSNPHQVSALFYNLTSILIYGRIVNDSAGKPVDAFLLDVNRAFEKEVGARKEDVLGRRITEVIPDLKNDSDWIDPYVRAAIGRESFTFEKFFPTSKKWYEITIYSPQKSYFVSISRDITPRMRAEEALKESEAKYRDLFTSMEESFELMELVYKDGKPVDYIFLDVNPAWEKMTGLRKDQVVRRRASEAVGSVESYWPEALEQAIKTGEPVHMENYGAALDKWYSVNVWKHSEKTCGVTITDITERKKAEVALRENREDLNRAQEVARTGSWRLDVNRNELLWSDENHRIFGIPKGVPLSYQTFLGVVHPEDREYVDRKWNAAIGGEPYDIEHRIVVGDEVMWVREKAELEFKDGVLQGGFGTTQDITEIKRSQYQLEEYSKKLERSNAELQQFAYIASHDLQEPLRMIVGHLGLLEKKLADRIDENTRQNFELAIDGGVRMKSLIDDLLEYSRIDSRAKPFATVEMNKVVEKAVKNLSETMKEAGAKLVVHPLPSVWADESQMVQLMQNLLGNAVKFHGKEKPRIEVSYLALNGEVIFSVKDNGIGLNMLYADRIFQMFERLDSKQPGTGIGLSISRKIVERHSGRIWVESEEGKGATFFFSLPSDSNSNRFHN
jgi:PAS domain S-box-containing protein